MTEDDAIALIDDLAVRPSPDSFRWLCGALAELSADAVGKALAHAEEKLAEWPDEFRTIDPRSAVASTPVVGLARTLSGAGGMPALPDAPSLTRVAWRQAGPAELDALAGWAQVGTLEHVSLDDWRHYRSGAASGLLGALDRETVTGLRFVEAASAADELTESLPSFTSLGSLALGGFGEQHLHALADAPWRDQLDCLELELKGLSEEAVLSTLEHLAGASVRVLRLTGKVGPAVAKAIATRCPNLEELQVAFLGGGLAAFCEAAGTKTLRSLSLARGSKTPAADIVALAAWAGAASLRTLQLVRARDVDDAAVAALAGSKHLRGLEGLLIEGASFGDAALESWAEREPAGLRRLELAGLLDISDDGVAALAASPGLADLEVLALRDNEVGDKGFQALASSEYLGSLRELDISDSNVAIAGVQAILGSSFAGRLEVLNIGSPIGKSIGKQGAKALANAPLERLQVLSIVGQNIPADYVLSILTKSKTLCGLVYLDISENPQVGDSADRVKKALRDAGFTRLQEVLAEEER